MEFHLILSLRFDNFLSFFRIWFLFFDFPSGKSEGRAFTRPAFFCLLVSAPIHA
ncbi:hypothetical protein SynA1840_01842 [Synechococcus sp. A18-40]|nr:hypothetical protein SynA1840_01842 [Synechococcus sp. A18-40]